MEEGQHLCAGCTTEMAPFGDDHCIWSCSSQSVLGIGAKHFGESVARVKMGGVAGLTMDSYIKNSRLWM